MVGRAAAFALVSPFIYFSLIGIVGEILWVTRFPLCKAFAADCKGLLSSKWQAKATTGTITLGAVTVATGLSVLPVLSGEYPLLESLILGQMTLGIWFLYPTMVYTFMFWAIGRLERPEERAQVGCFRPSSSVILSKWAFGFVNTWMVFLISWFGALWSLRCSPFETQAISVALVVTVYLVLLSTLILILSFVLPIPRVKLTLSNDRYESNQVCCSVAAAGALWGPAALYVYLVSPAAAAAHLQANLVVFTFLAVPLAAALLFLAVRWGARCAWRFLGEPERDREGQEEAPAADVRREAEPCRDGRFRRFIASYISFLAIAVLLMALQPCPVTGGLSGGLSVVAVALLSGLWKEKPRGFEGHVRRGAIYLAFLVFHVVASVKLALLLRELW